MGIHAVFTLLTSDIAYDPMNLIKYLPVSMCYILSMACSFFGIRFIEESLADPIENTSGAMCSVLCVLLLGETIAPMVWVAIAIIVIGILGVSYMEKSADVDRRKRLGSKLAIVAFAMPFCYALIDALGSFLDIFFLELETSPLVGVNADNIELVANVSYELTFAIIGLILFAFMQFKKVKFELPQQKDKIAAAFPNCSAGENDTLLIKLASSTEKQKVMKRLADDFDVDEIRVFEPSLNDIFVEYAGDQV
jgi:multidrug transporter EmrE-like cation transporter